MDPRTLEVEDFLCDDSFLRYCRGEERSDALSWETWIRENPDKLPKLVDAKRLFDLLNLGQGNRLEQLAALKDALDRHRHFKEQVLRQADIPKPARIIPFTRNSLVKYAASIIILVSLGALVFIKYGKKATGQLYAYEYYTTTHGHKTVMLPDSSIVMLNENSHLSINKDFDAQHRQVTITGEAFFDIRHDAEHPFLVNTAQYQIRVLGTSFNVRSYPGKGETETTLITGNIEIIQNSTDNKETKDKLVLKPNEKFIYQPVAGVKKVVHPQLDTITHQLAETSWARRKIEISDKSFEEIAVQLEHWYGIKIRFADTAVQNYRYTATFDDETIIRVLQYLQQSFPFSYTIKDDCIVIAKS